MSIQETLAIRGDTPHPFVCTQAWWRDRRRINKLTSLFVLISAVVILNACGGGGSSSDDGDQNGGGSSKPYDLLSTEEGAAEIEMFGDSVNAAFMANGDGIAIWRVDSGTERSIRYASYTASNQTWSADSALINGPPSDAYLDAEIASGTNSIAVIYTVDSNAVYVAVYSNGQASTPQLLEALSEDDADAGYSISGLLITASDNGYAASWTKTTSYDPVTYTRERVVQVSTLASLGGTWSAPVSLNASAEIYSTGVLLSNGSSFLRAWSEGDHGAGNNGYASHFDGSTWLSTPIDLGSMNDSSSTLVGASNGHSYQLGWSATDRQAIQGSFFSSNLTQASTATLLPAGAFTRTPKIISNGAEYLVSYSQSQEISLLIGSNSTDALLCQGCTSVTEQFYGLK